MSHMRELLERTKQTLEDQVSLQAGMGVVAGISGGADSVFLLHLLKAVADSHGMHVVGACLNHGLRKAAAEEFDFVRQLCRDMGVPFHGGVLDAGLIEETPGESMEMGARRHRHRFLTGVRNAHGAGLVATGHNATDSIETIMINISRGAGVRGLCGIEAVRNGWIRPLIGVSAFEIRKALDEAAIPYVSDSSNESPDFLRNRVRKTLLPAWTSVFEPDIHHTWGRTASQMRVVRDALRNLILAAYGDYLELQEGAIRIRRDRFPNPSLPEAGELVLFLLETLTGSTFYANRAIVENMLAFCTKSGSGDYDPFRRGHFRIARSPGWLYFMTRPPQSECVFIEGPGEYAGWFGSVRIGRMPNGRFSDEFLSFREYPFPWNWAPARETDFVRKGDRRVSIRDYLKKKGVGILERDRMPILTRNGQVLWIPDLGITVQPCAPDDPGAIVVYRVPTVGLQSTQIAGTDIPDLQLLEEDKP